MSLALLLNGVEVTRERICQDGQACGSDEAPCMSEERVQRAKAEVKKWLNKLPKGSRDWQDKGPQTEGEFSALANQLTNVRWRDIPTDSISPHVSFATDEDQDMTEQDRRRLPYVDILKAFLSRHANELLDRNRPSEMHMAVLAAAAYVAVKKGVPAHRIDELANPNTIKVKDLRAGICKYLCILDTMERTAASIDGGVRVLATGCLLLPGPPFILSARSFGNDHFQLLKTAKKVGKVDDAGGGENAMVAGDIFVYLPDPRPYETRLHIAEIVHGLYAGRLTWVALLNGNIKVSYADRAGRLGEIKTILGPASAPARSTRPGRGRGMEQDAENDKQHDRGSGAEERQQSRPSLARPSPAQLSTTATQHKPIRFDELLRPYGS
ncbi:hypothetical protein FCULG_00012798 [Fusarium culmorum]|uniref:Uncharacterized protein n=1 Tax=Fusarium culmorum TaxID=5516 RepID=A0A2T4GIM9_FUSCU|nr:hypothetical protein FCULG_00012798 [Fusarium culmorum]